MKRIPTHLKDLKQRNKKKTRKNDTDEVENLSIFIKFYAKVNAKKKKVKTLIPA